MPSREEGNPVVAWLGDAFDTLHPLLRELHRHGGLLEGEVTLRLGNGLAGVIGRRLARKLGLPENAGTYRLRVDIHHDAGTLHWNRCFDGTHWLKSSFSPYGTWPDGYWTEITGPVRMALQVDVLEGGWHWRVCGMRVAGIRIPLWLMPRSTAYKTIENGKYRFEVGFAFPGLGEVLGYGGLLLTTSPPKYPGS